MDEVYRHVSTSRHDITGVMGNNPHMAEQLELSQISGK